jgi:hypothetical protein
MYNIELSEAAVADLDHFRPGEIEKILSLLLSWADNPKPVGMQAFSMPEAADGMAYLYEADAYNIFFNIFEAARVAKIVAIFRKFSLN